MPCKKHFFFFGNNYYEEFLLLSLEIKHFVSFRRKSVQNLEKDRVALRGDCSCHRNVATQADALFNNVHWKFMNRTCTFEVRWKYKLLLWSPVGGSVDSNARSTRCTAAPYSKHTFTDYYQGSGLGVHIVCCSTVGICPRWKRFPLSIKS